MGPCLGFRLRVELHRSSYVISDQHIMTGVFPGFSWIRCEGKGSFLNSSDVKSFGDERIAAGEKLLVVDLGGCTGMDSTFMGTLAGLASRISAKMGGALHVAEPGERNRASLEDLGLDFMMEIDPPTAPWRGRLDEIRASLATRGGKQGSLPSADRANHVLEAHKNLSAINRKNAQEFKNVVDALENDVSRHGKPGEPQSER